MPDQDPPPTNGPGVIVIGTRAVAQIPGGSGGGGGGPGEPGVEQDEVGDNPGGGGGLTQEEADAENKRQEERAAKKFKTQLQAEWGRRDREFFTFTWIRDGLTRTHEIRPGLRDRIPFDRFLDAAADFGFSLSEITALNHSYPSNVYCDGEGENLFNQTRSSHYSSQNDLDAATYLVNNYQVNPDTLALYIADCSGAIRGFRYSDREAWTNARNNRLPPPAEIDPTGCEEE